MTDTSTASRLGFAGLLTVLVTAVAGFNSLVVGCAADRASRDAAQRHRVEERERFWTDAMEDLAGIVKARAIGGAEMAGAQAHCRLLATRTAPFLDPAPSDSIRSADGEVERTPEMLELERRAYRLQQAFVDKIRDPELIDPGCSQTFDAARIAAVAQGDHGAAVVAEAAAGATPAGSAAFQPSGEIAEAILARQDLIDLTPSRTAGWDVDLFWCERRDEAGTRANFDDALAMAEHLAARVQAGEGLGGVALGRVRLRMLASSLQGQGGYRRLADGGYILLDRPAEREVARAFAQVRLRTPQRLRVVERFADDPATATDSYVALFHCANGTPMPPQDEVAPAYAIGNAS